MRRGEIWLVDFGPARGSEANKVRPAVVVSNDDSNHGAVVTGRGTVTVVPLTSNVERVYIFQTLLESGETGLRFDSKIQPELTRAVAVSRLNRHIGTVSQSRMLDVDKALKLHLDLV